MKIAHISLYPPRGAKHVNGSGVISYTKNLVAHIGEDAEQHMLTDRIEGKTENYHENGIAVHRCFDRNPLFVLQIHRKLREINPDVIHIQQEMALFGNILTALVLQFLVWIWRRKTVITMHHAVDPGSIDKAFVRQNNSNAPAWMVRLAFRMIITPLTRYSQQIIVHELMFKHILIDGYGADPNKIEVIPHGVEDLQAEEIATARRKLKLKDDMQVSLFMGYAAGYKGMDLLIEGFGEYAKDQPKAFLLIGAGKHPKLLNDETYLAKYQSYQDKAAKLIPKDQYRWVGFIDEDQIIDYYSAADVSLYPYTTTLSSSGPMAIAIGYERPFLGSSVFSNIFGSYPQLLFDRSAKSMADKLQHFFEHQSAYQNISAELKQRRLWSTVGQATTEVYRLVAEGEPELLPATDTLEDEVE